MSQTVMANMANLVSFWEDGDVICSRCGKPEIIRRKADGSVIQREFTCRCAGLIEQRNRMSIVWEDYYRLQFSMFDEDRQPEAYSRCVSIAKRWPWTNENFVFRGPFGAGKTHLAAAVAGQIQRSHGCFVVALSMAGLLHRMRAGEWDQLLKKVIDCDLFIADDFGRHATVTDWVLQQYFDMFDARLKQRRPWIRTTNFSDSEFVEKFGKIDVDMAAAIMERCKEREREVAFFGPSYRLRGKE
jgi:DNA replication protein DnaC